MMIFVGVKKLKKSVIQVLNLSRFIKVDSLKLKSFKKDFLRNYYYDYEELYYFYKNNIHNKRYLELKKSSKIYN